MNLIFKLLIDKIVNNPYVTGKIEIENYHDTEREIHICFQAGNIDYTIRLVEDRCIVLHITLDQSIRMHFNLDTASISTIIGLIGVEMFA